MRLEQISSFVSSLKNVGEFGTKVVITTTPTWRSVDNPYVVTIKEGRKVVSRTERVTKVTFYNGGIMIGGYYTNQITNQINKVGGDAKEWHTESMKGTKWAQYPYIMNGIKNEGQYYLRLTIRHNAPTPKELFFLDGKLVTDKEIIADIKSYVKPSYAHHKQSDFGVAEENQVRPINIKIENINYLMQNGIEIGDKSLIDMFK